MKLTVLVIVTICTFAGAEAKVRFKRADHYDVYRALDTDNETEAVRLIRSGVPVNFQDSNQQVAMHYAAKKNLVEVAKALIEKGYTSQINRGDRWGDHSLIESASRGSDKVMELLIENGGDVNKAGNSGKAPLHWAAANGFDKVIKILLENNANITAGKGSVGTPLEFAVRNGHQGAILLLKVAEAEQKRIQVKKYIDGVCERYIIERPIDYISGGREAKPEEFPWMVALGYFNRRTNGIIYGCGGTIISEQFILTAAHCTKEDEPPVVVRLGTILLDDPVEAKSFFVKEIYQHENYSNITKKNDIALIRIIGQITFTPNYRPACLETDINDLGQDVAVNVTGWGSDSFEKPKMSNVLLTAGLKTVPLQQCKTTYLNYNKDLNLKAFQDGVSDSQYCANDPGAASFICRGDSGGPLQVFHNSQTAHIVGIVSFGLRCGNEYPGIYTRVAYYLSWIVSHVWPAALENV